MAGGLQPVNGLSTVHPLLIKAPLAGYNIWEPKDSFHPKLSIRPGTFSILIPSCMPEEVEGMLPTRDMCMACPRTNEKHSYIVTAFSPRLPCPSPTSLSSLNIWKRAWLADLAWDGGLCPRPVFVHCMVVHFHLHDANGRAARTGQDDWLPHHSFASGDTRQ